MVRYSLEIENNAKKELAGIYKSGNKADIRKVELIFVELEEHPRIGTGIQSSLNMIYRAFGRVELTKKTGLFIE